MTAMPPLSRHAHLFVAVFLVFMLGVITATYLIMFPPVPPLVSCTAATGCAVPNRPYTPHRDDDPDDMTHLVE